MVFIVRQGGFQEGLSMVILLLVKETFKKASPWLFYCEARRISRGLFGHMVFIVRQEDFQEGVSMVLYCEARRLSRGRLHSYFIVRQREFQEGSLAIWFLL